MRKAYLVAPILILVLVLLAGCMRVQSVVVTPLSSIVATGGTVAFAATDEQGNPVLVTWAVAAGPGTISAAGIYTAPATATTVRTATVTATYAGITAIAGSAVVTIVPPDTAQIVDAEGDAFGPATFDVLSISTERTTTTMTITVVFDSATPPVLPAAGAIVGPGDLAGFIDFDLDQSDATGFGSANALFCPCTPLSAIGSDAFVSLFERNDEGNYNVISTATLVDIGDAEPDVTGDVLTLTIALDDLDGDDGVANLSSVLGDFLGPSDCMPDEGAAFTTSVSPKGIEPEIEQVHAYFLWLRYGEFEWGVQTAPITI